MLAMDVNNLKSISLNLLTLHSTIYGIICLCLIKKGIFPNLMWVAEKSWFLSPEVWLCVEKVLGIPQRMSKDSPLFW